MPRITVVNPHHWLNGDGSFPDPSPLRSRVIRVAQFIEAGGPLGRGESRETLMVCRCRPGGRPCVGFMAVLKQSDDAIQSFCTACTQDEFLIYEWENTPWAGGPPAAVQVEDLARSIGRTMTPPRAPGLADLGLMLERALAILGSHLSTREVMALVRTSEHPAAVIRSVMSTLSGPPTEGAVERFLPVLMDVWNQTPRPDLGEESPERVYAGSSAPTHEGERNKPCPCGSGKRLERCCIDTSRPN